VIEVRGDIFSFKDADAIAFTSNGIVKNDESLVMGAGIAKAFRDRFRGLDLKAGRHVKANGNVVGVLTADRPCILNFPTKNHWKTPSDLALIVRSAKRLVEITNERRWNKVCLTRFGCGLGGLNWWQQVKPATENILDDRFYVVSL
jgi:hypothetical protein